MSDMTTSHAIYITVMVLCLLLLNKFLSSSRICYSTADMVGYWTLSVAVIFIIAAISRYYITLHDVQLYRVVIATAVIVAVYCLVKVVINFSQYGICLLWPTD